MPPRKRQQVLDLNHPRLSQSTWATTQSETDSIDGTEHEYTAYDHVPHQDSGIRFATNAPTVVPDRTTPMVLDQEYMEDEQIAVSAASKTKVASGSNTNWRCEWLKHKADEQIRLQATCNSQDEGEDEVEERADTNVTIKQCDGGVEEHFDIDEIIEELEKEEARHAHSGEEDLDGTNEEDEGKASLSKAPIDHLIAPSMDPDQNPYVLFMHTNGLHLLPYIQCGCGGLQERITGAIWMQLMPASFTIFKTMFTFDILEDFCLANLKCKTLAYQYYQLLR
ncbi:hypothetical protein BDN71DRAFT_1521366 [Pleurotus eryngii]|uniref:CxC2-like cysteine cluster KDZ transposase-associated domain-containing protein n=1 Tax=Pleurotus eryngii TaxID=5323 RepID=A0A9P5ZNM6_PLEER|nr:hypothetical protein BDN71DRAFT_1521366 [Pleurotus eryngii]